MQEVSMRGRIFYGWWLLVGLFLIYAASNGILLNTMPRIFPNLATEFGWTNEQVTRPANMFFALVAFLNPVAGWLLDRYSIRRLMLIGTFGITLVLALLDGGPQPSPDAEQYGDHEQRDNDPGRGGSMGSEGLTRPGGPGLRVRLMAAERRVDGALVADRAKRCRGAAILRKASGRGVSVRVGQQTLGLCHDRACSGSRR